MSSEESLGGRCFVKKLDFENCIVTNIKTKARRRRKLRARITREVEDFGFGGETSSVAEPASPVLVKKRVKGSESPVLSKRRAGEKSPAVSRGEEATPLPSSPVFKVGGRKFSSASFDRSKRSEEDFVESNSSSGFRIEEASSQESNPNVEISSVESTLARSHSSGCSVDVRIDTNSESSSKRLLWDLSENSENQEKCQSLARPAKRIYKKNSLLGRLHKLLQKQASQKLLWQHQHKRNGPSAPETLLAVSVWNAESTFFVKCRSSDSETTFLIVNSFWVPNVKKISEGHALKLHPPWQKISLEDSQATVLLNVICLEITEETQETFTKKETFRSSLPANEFMSDEKLLMESLTSSRVSGLLW